MNTPNIERKVEFCPRCNTQMELSGIKYTEEEIKKGDRIEYWCPNCSYLIYHKTNDGG